MVKAAALHLLQVAVLSLWVVVVVAVGLGNQAVILHRCRAWWCSGRVMERQAAGIALGQGCGERVTQQRRAAAAAAVAMR
jgi:hypothetical protein